jgi:hypothetical protein
MKLKTTVRLVIFLLIMLAAMPVLAAPLHQDAPPEFTLSAILLWIATGPGAAYLVGLFVSQILENLPFWHKLPPAVKFTITLVLAFTLPIGATYALQWPGLPAVEPMINIGIMSIVLWLASQKQYRELKDNAPFYGIRSITG